MQFLKHGRSHVAFVIQCDAQNYLLHSVSRSATQTMRSYVGLFWFPAITFAIAFRIVRNKEAANGLRQRE